ncbi:caspase, EACC1-associated type [Amycolatopsis sp. cmx-4-54]|uniref:caspase, EACC1-associated type n=1 Tax=Amycolatopsis sp. cmx-4-54 TaxID=2790936 RepID=UPI00397A02E5
MSDRASPWRDYSRSRAVLIGAWDYVHLPVVTPARNSLERMARLLTGPLCGWPEDRVQVVGGMPRRNDLPDRLMEWYDGVEDIAVFYFVGHGQLHNDELCLALPESPAGGPRRLTTGLPFADVRAALRECDAQTKIVILDCCFAGNHLLPPHSLAAPQAMVDALLLGTGAFTMAATKAYRTAQYETGTTSDLPQTCFTKYLVDVIERGIPGHPAGLPLGTIFAHTADALVRDKWPEPTRSSRHDADRFVLSRNVLAAEAPATTVVDVPRQVLQPPSSSFAVAMNQALARSVRLGRNRHLPHELPAIWVTLGELDHANELVEDMSMYRTLALIRMVQAAGPVVTADRYLDLVGRVKAAVAAESSRDYRPALQGYLAMAFAVAGDGERARKTVVAAEAGARAFMGHPPARDAVFADLAEAAAVLGQFHEAARLARAIDLTDNPGGRVRALSTVAAKVAAAGERDLALEIGREAVVAIQADDPFCREHDQAKLLQALAPLGDHELYGLLIDDAATRARSGERSIDRGPALAAVALAAAMHGDHRLAAELVAAAEDAAYAVVHDDARASVFADLMVIATTIGDRQHYTEFASEAEAATRAIADPSAKASALLELMRATDDADRNRYRELVTEAENAAHAVPEPSHRGMILCRLAGAVAESGDSQRAVEIATATEAGAWASTGELPGLALPHVVEAIGHVGDHDRARQLAKSIDHSGDRVRSLAKVARAAVAAGCRDIAVELVTEAEGFACDLSYTWPLSELIEAAAALGAPARAAGLLDQAERIVGTGSRDQRRAEDTAWVAAAAAVAGDHERAARLVAATLDTIDGADDYVRSRALVSVVRAKATMNDTDDAEALAHTFGHPHFRGQALVSVVDRLLSNGRYERAEQLAKSIEDPSTSAEALARVGAAIAATANRDHAIEMAVAAETTARRIAYHESRNRALGEVISVLSTVADRSTALSTFVQRLVTEILKTTEWYHGLPAVAHLDPAAVRALCDTLSARIAGR